MTRATRTRGEWRPAATLPVARVAVDVALAHLDRPFDYRVPAHLDDVAVPGVRVRVRFAGRLVDGFLLERVGDSDHVGQLAWVDKVVSPEPVLTAEVAALCRAVADRCAGVMADVLRLAVPPRHARVEAEAPAEPGGDPEPGARNRRRSRDGLGAVPARAGAARRAGGGPGGPRRVAGPARRGVGGPARRGRGRHRRGRAAARCSSCPTSATSPPCTRPARRGWGRRRSSRSPPSWGPPSATGAGWRCGGARCGSWWAPVRRRSRRSTGPGCSPSGTTATTCTRSPARPTRTSATCCCCARTRAGAALLVGGFARTAEAQVLVESGWAQEVVADRATLRTAAPRVTALDETGNQLARDPDQGAARLPAVAFEAARAALAAGRPVLVQVPRAGYLPWLACAQLPGDRALPALRGPAGAAGRRIGRCTGGGAAAVPLVRAGRAAFRCPACASRRLRAGVVGAGRTAEELGRAFPGATVRTSGGGAPVLDRVPGRPDLVVATPGAEPPAEGGYGAALLLDGWAMLSRPGPAGGGGDAAPLDGGGGAGRAGRRRRRRAGWSWSPTRRCRRCRRWCAGTRPGTPPPSWPRAPRSGSRPRCGWRRSRARPRPSPRSSTPSWARTRRRASARRASRCSGRSSWTPSRAPDPAAAPRERALVRVPRAQGRALAPRAGRRRGPRSARKAPDPVRVRLDPPEVG